MASKASDSNTSQPRQIKRWIGGISDYLKESAVPDAYYFGVSINYRTDPQSLTLLPGAKNESGNVITDLLKWGDIVPDTNLTSYFYGDTGNIYKRTNQGQWSLLHNSTNSHGNGMAYFTGDGYLYYANDSTLGRYGQITTVYQLSENWSSGITSTWFNWGGAQVAVSNGLLTISSTLAAGFYGIELAAAQNLTGYAITNQLASFGSTSPSTYEVYPIYATIRGSSSNQLFWYINVSGNLRAYKKVAGVNTIVASTTYDAAVHKYFKIREDSGTIYYDYSTDSTNWLNLGSVSNPFAVTSMTIGQQVGTSGTELTTTSASFDNFSFAPGTNAAQFADNFLRSQGGTPLNTYSLTLLSASSQYATAADSASLSITSDLTLEAFVKFTSLPAVGSSMTMIGKWDENANTRSYKMDIYGISGFFGDGSAGSLTISADTTQAPTDATCSGASGSNILLATNASFVAGNVILIHQTQGTNAGQWERNTIQSYTTGQIITATPLLGTYGTGAQVIVVPQYTTVTVNTGKTWTAKAWTGSLGGILLFLANGAVSIVGTITATGKGFRGGSTGTSNGYGQQGVGTAGVGTTTYTANSNGGGGGFIEGPNQNWGSGGGGGNASTGATGVGHNAGISGIGGLAVGANNLTTMDLGGGGGAANGSGSPVAGGAGGGIIFATGSSLTITGAITSAGQNGTIGAFSSGVSGAGAGGSILLKFQTGTLGTGLITASGGSGPTSDYGSVGGAGSAGRIAVYYLTSYTGTTSPTINATQDSSLVTTVSYQLRLGVSSTGTNSEYLTKNLTTISTGVWTRFSVSWTAASSLATFYQNAALLGTSTGTLTAIANTAALLYVGADKGASAVGDFLNAQIDDVRIWSNVQTAAQIQANNVTQVVATSGNLVAEYLLNNAATDSTANANNLTLVAAPTYSTDVPFPDSSTRLDIDQSGGTGGDTYALTAAISETAANSLPVTPAKDPQASVQFTVNTKGTGNWTVIVHDQQNREITRSTIALANIPAAGGTIEFVFSPAWRVVPGKTYHFHLISSDASGKIVSSTSNNLSTATYVTYFQFLVTDTQFHPILPFLNYMVIGNERYLATWDGAFYQPNLITFPAGTKVRALSFWREFLAIGVWRGNNITDYDQGKIYFWDGIAPTFNFFIDVPQGQIASLYGKDSDLYLFAGYRGVLMKYTGGGFYANGNSATVKLKRVPKIAVSDYLDIYPGALTIWRDLVHFGLAANSSSSTLTRATYSWGSLNQLYPETLSCDYPLSTGNTGSTVSIGLTFPVGQNLIVGWRDGVATGADVINFSNPPAASGYIQTLVEDDDAIWKDKLNFDIRADHLALASGESVQVGISIDRDTFTTGGFTSTDTLFTKLPVVNGRGREYQLQATLYATGTTSPTLLALGVLHNETPSEAQF